MNIVLMILDTVRKDYLSTYGARGFPTPNVERMAEESVLYSKVISPASWTTPVHASLFTGLYPSSHGTHGGNLTFETADDRPSLMGMLKRKGYRCVGISTNYLVSEQFGFSGDFDEFYQIWQLLQQRQADYHFGREGFQNATRLQKALSLLKETVLRGNGRNAVKSVLNRWYSGKVDIIEDATPSTLRALKLARRAVERAGDMPLFLFVNLMQAHEKYNPPRRVRDELGLGDSRYDVDSWMYYAGKEEIGECDFCRFEQLYGGEVTWLDHCVGGFIDFLRAGSSWDDTMVAVVSDHGELIGEHGQLGHLAGLFGELIDVPLIVKYPRGTANPGEDGGLRQSHDLFPTILELAGAGDVLSGDSVSLLSGDGRKEAISQLVSSRFLQDGVRHRGGELRREMSRYARPMMALIQDDFKYVAAEGGHEWLFDLSNDPCERADLVVDDRYVSTVERMRGAMRSAMAKTGFEPLTPDLPLDGEIEERLKAMGYI